MILWAAWVAYPGTVTVGMVAAVGYALNQRDRRIVAEQDRDRARRTSDWEGTQALDRT